MQLRPYQQEAIELLRQAYREGRRRVVFCGFCSFGKTILTTSLIESALAKGSRCLFLTNRISLVQQTVKVFEKNGLDVSIMWAGEPTRFVAYKKLQVACTETLRRRLQKEGFAESFGTFDFVFTDECHLVASVAYKQMFESLCHGKTALVGLTATPWMRGLKDVYVGGTVHSVTPQQLLEQGYVVPYRIVTGAVSPDLSKVTIDPKTGDYREGEAADAMMKDFLYADIIKTYKQFADGKRGIVFCAGQQHAMEMVRQFTEAGYPAALVIAQTPVHVRQRIFDDTRSGKNLIICSVDAVSEGLDVVEIEAVMLCKPTKSVLKYIQRAGRGVRLSPHTGKLFCWLIDFVGCWEEHGSPYDEREYYLPRGKKPTSKNDGEEEEELPKMWKCSECTGVNASTASVCHVCGAPKPKPPPKKMETLNVAMKEVSGKEWATTLTTEKKREIYGALLSYCQMQGWKEGRAYFMYKEFFGVGPSGKKIAGKLVPELHIILEHAEKKKRQFLAKQSYQRKKEQKSGFSSRTKTTDEHDMQGSI
jgi:superfamily II DNA or RNA helicase